eukprot:symbB.v1.2.037587.t1/scaffold5593.1/size27187/4
MALLEGTEKEWPNDSWNVLRNSKGQTVLDAARVNRKGQVVDFLCERLGIEAETVKLPPEPAPAAPAATQGNDSEAARARAALLAAAGAEAQAPNAANAMPGGQAEGAAAMRAALDKLKSNPEAVEQAKKMMGMMPPQMLQTLTGGKVSEEQAKKAMDAIAEMSSEELLEKADLVSNKMAKETVPVSPESSSGSKPARSVD